MCAFHLPPALMSIQIGEMDSLGECKDLDRSGPFRLGLIPKSLGEANVWSANSFPSFSSLTVSLSSPVKSASPVALLVLLKAISCLSFLTNHVYPSCETIPGAGHPAKRP